MELTDRWQPPPAAHERGRCPCCDADLNGELIWQAFFNETADAEHADRLSARYGATRDNGRLSRAIAETGIQDAPTRYHCPECDYDLGERA